LISRATTIKSDISHSNMMCAPVRFVAVAGGSARGSLASKGTKAVSLTQPIDGVRLSHRVVRELLEPAASYRSRCRQSVGV
jgi:hypothetical protein